MDNKEESKQEERERERERTGERACVEKKLDTFEGDVCGVLAKGYYSFTSSSKYL
jgi:hypothetical protein